MATNGFQRDDSRLSAYALGELEGAERAEVEALLAESAEAREFVRELAETAAALERELAAEGSPGLGTERRAGLRDRIGDDAAGRVAAGAGAGRGFLGRIPAPVRAGLAAAAVIGVGLGLVYRLGAGWTARDEGGSPFTYDTWEGTAVTTPTGNAVPASSSNQVAAVPGTAGRVVLGQELVAYGAPASPGAGVPTAGGSSQLVSLGYAAGISYAPHPNPPLMDGTLYYKGPGDTLSPGDRKEVARGILDELSADRDAIDQGDFTTEAYAHVDENPFRLSADEPLSTFSIDVDTASYANVRRFLVAENRLPPAGAVRIEELVNYFRYRYPEPPPGLAFSVSTEVASAPWAPSHRLVRIGIRGRDVPVAERAPSNLVFLIDVSGSMDDPKKLPLLKNAMKMLVEQLDGRDRVAMVVYAGASGLALPSTACSAKASILAALEQLGAGGSTNGGAGIQLAYQTARENFLPGGINRVVLCTDGDFNVGTTDEASLVALIEEQRQSGVFLSVLGFGTGNLQDSTMEKLADKGNGNYAYIDALPEARKVLVEEMGGTLIAIAKDVKIQVEFNPAEVRAWRLVGYENRVLAHQDFNDDAKDAGEIGAGATVTALYEVVPAGVAFEGPSVDPLKYQQPSAAAGSAFSGELLNLKLRYKQPEEDRSELIETPVIDGGLSWTEASEDFRFASSVAGFAMLLRKSEHAGNLDMGFVARLANEGLGEDPEGYRREFLGLVARAGALIGGEGR